MMLTPEQIADGWIEHDGKHTPNSPVFIKCRDGVSLRFALPPCEWETRFEWWGARTKKPNDIIAYRPEANHAPD
jgi:hypothetical protein